MWTHGEGCRTLTAAILHCNAVACIYELEKGSFLPIGRNDSTDALGELMQLDVANDASYQHAIVNYGSRFMTMQ
jgi:hypothetical protein